MKKNLLLATALVLSLGASAQLKQMAPLSTRHAATKLDKVDAPRHHFESRSMSRNMAPAVKSSIPKTATNIVAGYHRPAGTFWAPMTVGSDGSLGMMYSASLMATPYVDYTWRGFADPESDAYTYTWQVQHTTPTGRVWSQVNEQEFTDWYLWGEQDTIPSLTVTDGTLTNTFQFKGKKSEMELARFGTPSFLLAFPNEINYSDGTSDTFLRSSVFATYYSNSWNIFGSGYKYGQVYLTGAKPYDPDGEEGDGRWFGKNGSGMNGVAMAFEQPEVPYLLKRVAVEALATIEGDAKLTCNVYKLDAIPAFEDTAGVELDAEPGELIATGRCDITLADTTASLLYFTLYGEEEGMEFEYTPTIDCPILVTIEGYNGPDAENLTDFSLLGNTQNFDEGFGELAYIKHDQVDSLGEVHTTWRGLNRFFRGSDTTNNYGMEWKSGFTLFLEAEQPFFLFRYADDGEYTFPAEGGEMEKTIEYTDTTVVTKSIEFMSYMPSADDGWFVLTPDEEEIPDWLNIKLTDQMTEYEGVMEYSGYTNALVTAEPLPAGTDYRECVVRFSYPGAYLDYKFMQGTKSEGVVGDVNGDGLVTIADANAIISIILNGTDSVDAETLARADVNGDGLVTIADANAVISRILGNA